MFQVHEYAAGKFSKKNKKHHKNPVTVIKPDPRAYDEALAIIGKSGGPINPARIHTMPDRSVIITNDVYSPPWLKLMIAEQLQVRGI
jgi:hypothetical protein